MVLLFHSAIVVATVGVVSFGLPGCSFDRSGTPIDNAVDASQPGVDAPTGIDAAPTPDAAPPDATPPPDAAPQPSCWTDPLFADEEPTSGHRYMRYSGDTPNRTWTEARDLCLSFESTLVIIESDVENAFVLGLGDGSRVWLGLHDRNTEGQFEWVDGTSLSYENWSGGQPDDWWEEDCAQMFADGTWNDIDCDGSWAIVCECDPDVIP